MCVVDVIGVPSKLRVIRKAEALARVSPTLDLSCEENAARRKWDWVRSYFATFQASGRLK